MSRFFAVFAVAFLLPGFAWAAESCHHAETAAVEVAAVADGHRGHQHAAAAVEEIPQTAASPETHGMEGDCPHHPGMVHSCSAQRALMKCGMHGCCIKSELPVADSGLSPKVSPEMALNVRESVDLYSLQGPVSPYLLEKLSNCYPPVPRPPAA